MQIGNLKSRLHQLSRPRPPVMFTWLAVFALTVSLACGDERANSTGTPAGNGSMTTAPIQIQNIDVLIAESYPPQVFVKVTGIIPDSCTKAREPEISHDGSTFTITIIGERPTGVACAQIVSTYEKSIRLGTLDPGSYTVVVNDVTKQFKVN